MEFLQNLVVRLRSLLGGRTLERELDDELRFHVEMQTELNLRRGMSPAAARQRALAEFGGVDRMAEECRDVRTGFRIHDFARSVRLAGRRLRREPGFVIPAVLTLALGMAALVSIFTLADTVLLRPLAYPDADRIVVLRHSLPGLGVMDAGQSEGTYVHYSEGARAFESIGAYFDRELSITDGDAPERVLAALVTPGVLSVLGIQPHLGRTFNVDDRGARGVLLGYELWQRRYGGDSAVVGSQIEVNGTLRDVVGVLPPGTDFPSAATQMLFGMSVTADEAGLRDMYLQAVARMRPGVTPADAAADLARLATTLPERYGDVTAEQLAEAQLVPRVQLLKESIVGEVRPALVLLLCIAVFVLLIALANVMNLVLVRAERQRREVALERALGAGGGTVALRFTVEYALLSFAGAALGLALAAAAVRWRFGFEPWQIPRLHDIAITTSTFVVTAAVAIIAAAILAAVGMLSGGRADVQAALKGSLQRVTASRESRLVQHGLSSLQVALACALLIGSAIMVQSMVRLGRVELGFRPANVVAFDLALPARDYLPYTRSAAFVDRLLEELRAIPGVHAADAVSLLPLTETPGWFDVPIAVPGMTTAVAPTAGVRLATPGYFATMGIPIVRGRTFEHGDLTDSGAGVVLAASLARRLFGDADPIGRTVTLPAERGVGTLTVIGVAGDVRDTSLTAPAAPLLYLPVLGAAALTDGRAPLPFVPSEPTIVVRSELPLATLLPSFRTALRSLDPRLPVARPRTADELVSASGARSRLTALLLASAAGIALLLGIVGIYGVVAYAVSRRTPELALRMALGAAPRDVLRSVLGQGALVAAVGVAAGVPVAFMLTRLLGSLLFEVSPHEPRAFVLVPAAMVLIALVASLAPARHAARTDPARALGAD